MLKNALRQALARPDPGDVPLSTGLANFGLSLVALAGSAVVFLLTGAIALSLLTLGAASAGLFLWRKRLAYLAAAPLALLAGFLLLAGGGPTVGGFGLGTLLGSLAILLLFFPLIALLTDL